MWRTTDFAIINIIIIISIISTVIPPLTSDPAKKFWANEDFFRCFSDSANECFSGCAR